MTTMAEDVWNYLHRKLVTLPHDQEQAVLRELRGILDQVLDKPKPDPGQVSAVKPLTPQELALQTTLPEMPPAYLDLTGGELLTIIHPADPDSFAKHTDGSFTLRWAPPMPGLDADLIRSQPGVRVIIDENQPDYLQPGWTEMRIGVVERVNIPKG